ncbi:MAG: hypothetical protein MJK12_06100 [Colwellia sp.]|nr:hypothetical protein [Colwellia sp.]
MKINFILIGVLFIACAVCGCSSQAKNRALSAVITEPSEASNIELQDAIASLVGQKQILIAKDAFTQNNSLTIERMAHRAQNGQLINGRVIEKPQLFYLVIRDGQCIVKNSESNEEKILQVTKCRVQ